NGTTSTPFEDSGRATREFGRLVHVARPHTSATRICALAYLCSGLACPVRGGEGTETVPAHRRAEGAAEGAGPLWCGNAEAPPGRQAARGDCRRREDAGHRTRSLRQRA